MSDSFAIVRAKIRIKQSMIEQYEKNLKTTEMYPETAAQIRGWINELREEIAELQKGLPREG